ncbi:MAG: TetR/AcrR family transcriptional regulator [Rhizomicrobium sp.]
MKPLARNAAGKAPRPKRHAYHHGDLRAALLAASESILLERGVQGFTLREAARRAGVSPAAPAHHFGDVAGLLSAVAREGFLEFGRRLREADEAAGADPSARLTAQGTAYVRFALAFPARFQLMFRCDLVDMSRGDLAEIANASFATLDSAVRSLAGTKPGEALSMAGTGALLASWAMVHGFAHLALEGQFGGGALDLGGKTAILDQMLPAMLRYGPDKLR